MHTIVYVYVGSRRLSRVLFFLRFVFVLRLAAACIAQAFFFFIARMSSGRFVLLLSLAATFVFHLWYLGVGKGANLYSAFAPLLVWWFA